LLQSSHIQVQTRNWRLFLVVNLKSHGSSILLLLSIVGASCGDAASLGSLLVLRLVLQKLLHKDIELFSKSLDCVLSVLAQLLTILNLGLQKFS